MIRRDYILRMIEEFMQVLSKISSLKRDQHWQEARVALEEETHRQIGLVPAELAQLTETELLARIIQTGPGPSVRTKTLMMTTLLKEAGDLAASEDRNDESRQFYLKGLHLLLGSFMAGDREEVPEFVPKIQQFVDRLTTLPPETAAMLMQHYERSGEYGKAEDSWYSLWETDPKNPRLIQFGISFYERLEAQSDAHLENGGLPRDEVQTGLAELRKAIAGSGG